MSSSPRTPVIERPDANWNQTLQHLRAFIAARVGDYEVAGDITQNVIVRSIASGALDRVDNPSAWLYRSARNAVIDHYRTRRIHEPIIEPDLWPDPDPQDEEPNEATRALARCLTPMLNELPDTARDALTRVDLHGQTHQQAAEELGVSVSGMKSRVQRARRQLKDRLTRCCRVDLDRTGAVTDYHPVNAGCACP